jgi:hypothetical protein
MKRIELLIITCLLYQFLYCQQKNGFLGVTEIKWELDYQIYMKLSNDSNYTVDIKDLFHIKQDENNSADDYVYYPVNLGEEYVDEVMSQNADTSKVSAPVIYKSLWGALHASLGGGWVHFINCLSYSLETRNLSLNAPLMERPKTNWKPDPETNTYLRTKKWEFYVPVSQKIAIKEYRIREAKGELGDLKSIPKQYIDQFLSCTDKKYNKLKDQKQVNALAKIDLVKLMLGINYLGQPQILYIRSAVLKAVENYSVNKLPSVLIFDKYAAAAAMSLGPDGYTVQALAFRNTDNLSAEEMEKRKQEIFHIVAGINTYNQNLFMKRLGDYYQK